MVRVGIPEVIDERYLRSFPREATIIRLPEEPEPGTEIDFWIAPLYPGEVKKMFPRLKGVKVVQALWAGIELLVEMLPREITICDAQGSHNIATSEWVVAAILATLKQLPFYSSLQQSGEWRRRAEADEALQQLYGAKWNPYPPALVEELAGKTVLIVGYGSIGQSIEARLSPFEVKVLRVARRAREGVEDVSRLRDLIPVSDVVVLIVPLTGETTGLFGEEEFRRMKRGALLVNAARGPVVNTAALLKALESGSIRAVLDVTDPEPLPEGHPLWRAPNLLITPHVAGSSDHSIERPMAFAAEQVRRYMQGEPLKNVAVDGY